MINSGRSLGDNRVDWRTVTLALKVAARQNRDVIIIAADSAPPTDTSRTFIAEALTAARAAGRSACLLGASTTAAVATTTTSTTPVCIAALNITGTVTAVTLTTSGCVAADASVAFDAATAYNFAPLFYILSAADVAFLTSSEGVEAVSAAGATRPTKPAEEIVVPIEAAAGVLATRGRLIGVLPGAGVFTLGALDGSVRPAPKRGSIFAHVLPVAALGAVPSYATGHARVGLLGNPSDGYGGKTMSVTIANFKAEAWVTPTPGVKGVTLIPHAIYDPLRVPSLAALSLIAQREGYSGGIRLMAATLNRFQQWVTARGVVLPKGGFAVRYHTTVPRQVGLAGSSAIVTALVRALLSFFGYGTEEGAASLGLSRDLLPAFVLAIEGEELGIVAGLQDRVVQSYQCAVHMNFDPAGIAQRGHGAYTRVAKSALPPIFLAYAADPSDSGRIHAPIKQRWLAGDVEVSTKSRNGFVFLCLSLNSNYLCCCTFASYVPPPHPLPPPIPLF